MGSSHTPQQAFLNQSEPFKWEKIGKVVNQVKLAVLNQSEPLWWEKIGKVTNWMKLPFQSHSELP